MREAIGVRETMILHETGRCPRTQAAQRCRRFLLLLAALASLLGAASAQAQSWYDAAWSHRKPITIDRTKVSGGPFTNFPVLVSLASDAQLASKAQASGNDILFTADDGTTKLDHEIERYTSATGALVAWVKIPSLPSTADTVIYMYYGNAAAANQQNGTEVWTSGFSAVYHLNDNNLDDSTSNARHATNTGTLDAAGVIANGRQFVVADGADKLAAGTWNVSSFQNFTIQAWVKFSSLASDEMRVLSKSNGTELQDHAWAITTTVVSGDHRFRFMLKTGGSDSSGTVEAIASSGSIQTDVWYFVAGTYGGSVMRLYVNGAQVGSASQSNNTRNNSWNIALGNNATDHHPLDGVLDEVRVVSLGRSANWLATEYSNQNAPSSFYSVGAEQTGNAAEFVSQSVSSTMTAGQSYSVSVTMKNTGVTTWTAANDYRLGSQNAQNNTTWGLSRVNVPASVAPGENATFSFEVTAPASSGTYNFQWRMLRENVEWFGDLSTNVAVTVNPSVAGFNVVEPGAHAVTGKIFTQIAGQDFALDIVALDGANNVATGFTGTVAIEVVDATSGGACSGLPLIAAFTNQTFAGGDAGRKALSAPNTVANVYRNARVRVKFPASSPTVTACSGDNFAIRPNALVFSVTDQSPSFAGTNRTLNVLNVPGTPVHRAGRPFQITATAYNAAATPAITANYDGTPSAVLSACAGTACTDTHGTLDVGSWTPSGGTVTSETATYNDVGAFNLQLVDSTFAAVDAADGTPLAQRTISSIPIGVGRFVPDRYVASPVALTPRRSSAGCSASSFSYMGELFDITFTVTAQSINPNTTTTRYAGALVRLVLNNPASFSFGAVGTAPGGVATPLGSRLTVLETSGTWSNGVATVVAVVALQRGSTPDGPYTDLKVGILPTDQDNMTIVPSGRNLDTTLDGTNDRRLVGTTAVRFGRLRLQNAVGAPQVALPIPIEAQHWNGTAFVRNTDDNCTSIGAGNVALGNFQRSLSAAHTSATVGGAFQAGLGSLTLSAPGAANRGSVDVSVNLSGAAVGASCVAGMPASTASGQAFLQGAWCGAVHDRDPTARASFGALRAPEKVIYRRENF